MKSRKHKYWKLFISTFQLSACTFGGGFVIIPLVKKKFVEELGWMEEQEMLDFAAIAQASPGAIAVNISALVGYRVAKGIGVLLAVLGTVLPPLLIISVVSYFYQAFRNNIIIDRAMTGILAGVAAVICDVVINMTKELGKQQRIYPIACLGGAFVAIQFWHINIILIIFICGILGAVYTYRGEKLRRKRRCA